jgi:hypothetical protein
MASVPSNVVSVLNPTIPVNQSIYEQSDTQKTRLGTRLQVGDRVFYYARLSTSANVAAGDVLCAPQLIASHQSGIVTAASTGTGATVVTITAGTAFTLNQYAEGYLSFADSAAAGGGQMYRIKSHPAIATAASGAITLYDPLIGSVAAGAVNFTPCLFNLVKVGSQALDLPVGVAPIAVTTGNYFWIQTYGPAAPRHAAATVAAGSLRLGTTGGVISYYATGTLAATGSVQADFSSEIGKNLALAATATECNPVFLTILP